MKALNETLEDEEKSADSIRARAQDLTEAAMKLGEAIYKAETEAGQASEENNTSSPEPNSEDIVDADFEDLNKSDK